MSATRYLLIGGGSFALVRNTALHIKEAERMGWRVAFAKKHGVVNSENTFRVLRQKEKKKPLPHWQVKEKEKMWVFVEGAV